MREKPAEGSNVARNIISRPEACELPPAQDWMVEKPGEKRHHNGKDRE
jgi:hypothetical protein